MATEASPSEVEAEVASIIDGALTKLKERRVTLVTTEDEMKLKLAMVQTGIRAIDRVLNAAEPKTKAQPVAAKRTVASRFSQESLDETLALLKQHFAAGEFIVPEAMEKTGLAQSRIYPSIKALHEQGKLLKVGVSKEHRNAALYKIAPKGN